MVDHLRQLGQDVGVRANDGSTPMHDAARHGQTTMVDYLYNAGADITAKSRGGRTPKKTAQENTQIAAAARLQLLEEANKVGAPPILDRFRLVFRSREG